MLKRVLIALDGSAESERAVPWVDYLLPDAQVTLLRFVDPTGLMRRHLDDCQCYLDRLAQVLRRPARTLVKIAEMPEGMEDVVKDTGTELIALHARAPLPQLSVPVLRTPDANPPRIRLQKVIVSTDELLPFAREIAQRHNAELTTAGLPTPGAAELLIQTVAPESPLPIPVLVADETVLEKNFEICKESS
jgi:nucleotide-binding universal stress UspA family protein